MTNPVLCVRCGEPIAFGQPYKLISDERGNATYTHLIRVAGMLVESCPQPDPVAESGEEEEPAEDGPASLQVNTTASLPSVTERTAGETPLTDGAPLPRVAAAPFIHLDEVWDAMDTARRNDDDVHLSPEVVEAMLGFLERLANAAVDG